MRVMQIMAGADAGGAETMFLDGVTALAEAGVAQHAITRGAPGRLATLRNAGVRVDEADFNRLLPFATSGAIARAIREFQPDVLHFWMGRAGTFAPSATRAKNLGWYGGYYKLKRFRNCAWHAGVTSDIERHIVEQGAPADRASTLLVFANIETAPPLDRAQFDTPADAPLVLALARLHWKKGIDTLLDALAGLPGAYAWIAGAGPLEAELRAQCTKLGLDDRVRWLGWRTDRAALLAACDVVAFPSRYEPFGAVTPEAWAAERPLVVADAAGPKATVTHEKDALLVPKDDSAALRDALARLIAEPDLRARLVANGKRSYEARFTKQAFVRSAMTLYERIRASNGAASGK